MHPTCTPTPIKWQSIVWTHPQSGSRLKRLNIGYYEHCIIGTVALKSYRARIFLKMTQDAYFDPEKLKYDNFDARSYLEHYYSSPSGFEGMMKQLVKFYSSFPDDSLTVLNYAGGPSIEPLIFAADKAREYVHADYAQSSREEVCDWVRNHPGAFDWTNHTMLCLQLEGKAACAAFLRLRPFVR